MEKTPGYLDRKCEELSLLSACLRAPRPRRPESLKRLIEEKFRLAARLKSEHALEAWQHTQTRWCSSVLGSGPFTFQYRYQRADLAVSGPCPYRHLDHRPNTKLYAMVYACSGMGIISALLLAFSGERNATLVHLPGCYKETLELATNHIPRLRCRRLQPGRAADAWSEQSTVLWLDAPPLFGDPGLTDVARIARAADVIVLDTTCYSAASGRIRRFLRWAGKAGTPVVLVRSHTKLDTLGVEYGRLGSAVFLAFGNTPARPRRRMGQLAERTETIARLLGNKAMPEQFCPFVGSPTYWDLSRRRSAALLRNGRLLVRTLVRELWPRVVRNYSHGMFAALVPPENLGESESVAEAAQLAAIVARSSLPVRHAGSFGFDFMAIEGFFDTEIDRHVVRIAAGDVPPGVVMEAAERIASWWSTRWSAKAA